MRNYITVDGGTTNTRLSLVRDRKVMRTVKLPLGAKAGIDNRDSYRAAVRDAISELRKDTGGEGIYRILASGMITSEFGLCNLPHISAPAGIAELHEGMYETVLADISDIPFVFIPGIRISGGDLEHTDMMRGEEAELVG
ncbi:MAG: 2-dehydro-3-deoxygalactonokinase, partial [Clostridia bacterium]|nr:2-dehydro-3-deoxygalactonokinase [Clostridia bacterium]